MTVVVDETVEIPIYFNIPNLPFTLYRWTLTSQYSHEPVVIAVTTIGQYYYIQDWGDDADNDCEFVGIIHYVSLT